MTPSLKEVFVIKSDELKESPIDPPAGHFDDETSEEEMDMAGAE